MSSMENVGVVHDLLGRASYLAMQNEDLDPGLSVVVVTLALKSRTVIVGSPQSALPGLLPVTVAECVAEASRLAQSWQMTDLPKSAIGFVQELAAVHMAVSVAGRTWGAL